MLCVDRRIGPVWRFNSARIKDPEIRLISPYSNRFVLPVPFHLRNTFYIFILYILLIKFY